MVKIKKIIIIILTLFLLTIVIVLWKTVISYNKETKIETPTNDKTCEKCNVTLFVNKTNKYSYLRIKIYIDDNLLTDENIAVTKEDSKNPLSFSIAPHITQQIILNRGIHKIKAVAEKEKVVFEEAFEVKDKIWAILGYEFSPGFGKPDTKPNNFGFYYQNKPIYFQ